MFHLLKRSSSGVSQAQERRVKMKRLLLALVLVLILGLSTPASAETGIQIHHGRDQAWVFTGAHCHPPTGGQCVQYYYGIGVANVEKDHHLVKTVFKLSNGHWHRLIDYTEDRYGVSQDWHSRNLHIVAFKVCEEYVPGRGWNCTRYHYPIPYIIYSA